MSGVEIFQIWIMAFFTLALFSFLYKDNPLYKVAEHIFAGLSAGYYVGLIWESVLVQQLWQPMFAGRWWLVFPGILGVLMFARFTKERSWISRSSLAFVMAVTAGIFLISQLHGIVLAQVQSTMVPRTEPVAVGSLMLDEHRGVFTVTDSVTLAPEPYRVGDMTVSQREVARVGDDSLVIMAAFVDSSEAKAEDYGLTLRVRTPRGQKTVLLANGNDAMGDVSFRKTGEYAWEARYVLRPDTTLAVGAYDVEVEVARRETQVFLTVIILLGVIATLVYFYFSKEHVGVLGATARVGIWFIMISFGAHFGYTVMGRVSLLIGRVQFLLEDWIGTWSQIL